MLFKYWFRGDIYLARMNLVYYNSRFNSRSNIGLYLYVVKCTRLKRDVSKPIPQEGKTNFGAFNASNVPFRTQIKMQ